MAFDDAPSDFFGGGYSYASNAITLTTSAGSPALLTQLTNAEADATTGDWREVVFAIMEALVTKWEATADADRPTRVNISKYAGISGGMITHTYNVTVSASVITEAVATE